MENKIRSYRQMITEALQLLSSESQQLAYEKNVPNVDITVELLCTWFDDSYYPEEVDFNSEFDANELEELAHFNRFFEERDELLPESEGTVQTWLANKVWKEIMHEARTTLDKLKA